MACLFKGRTTKKIANILSISPKTVSTHLRNIMLRLETNSREGIIDGIEKAHTPFFKTIYRSLMKRPFNQENQLKRSCGYQSSIFEKRRFDKQSRIYIP
jgi:hypothetical protein